MKANPLQDKGWTSPDLVVQMSQERETKLSFTYEWTFSSYLMAASERLKTSTKAVRDAGKQLVSFCVSWCPGIVGKQLKNQTRTDNTEEKTQLSLCLFTLCCIYLCGNIKTHPTVDEESFSDCTKSLLLLKFTKAHFNSVCFYFQKSESSGLFFFRGWGGWRLQANANHFLHHDYASLPGST